MNINLKYIILLISYGWIFVSCNTKEEPYVTPPESVEKKVYILHLIGSNQYNGQNMYLNDSIAVRVIDSLTQSDVQGFQVKFSVQSGGGSLDNENAITNTSGFASTRWKLGDKTHEQKVNAKIFDENDSIVGSAELIGYAFRPNIWDTVVLGPHRYIDDMVTDTIKGVTLITTTSMLWKQGERYFDWNRVKSPDVGAFRIETNKDGVFFIYGYNGGLQKSLDQGETWINCNDPFELDGNDDQKPSMNITSDNSIWLSKMGILYHSTDNGSTWSVDTTGLKDISYLGEIFNTKDSTFILRMINSDCYKSENGGKSWSPLVTPYNPKQIFVTENNEIIIMNNEGNNVALHKSVDGGKTYVKTFSVLTKSTVGFPKNIFNEYKGTYYVLIPEFGIASTTNFENFEYYYTNTEANRLFIDHQGTFIVENTEWTRAFYKHNNDEN